MLLAALLAVLLRPAAAADRFAGLKPLLGDWVGECVCREGTSRQEIRLKRVKEGVLYNAVSGQARATGVLVPQGGEGRFKTVAFIRGVPLLTQLGLDQVPGSLSVSEDEDSEFPDLVSFSAGVRQTIRFLGGGRLKDGSRAFTYQVTTESPLGKNVCSGRLRKGKPGKAAAPAPAPLEGGDFATPR